MRKTSAMNFTADFDIASFGLGFAVAPVAYLVFGAAVYTIFCSGQWLASSFGRLRRRWRFVRRLAMAY
jgi:hypothetical protein